MSSPAPFIPFHLPSIGEDEIREVTETLRSGWLTTGARTQQFEKEFCQYTGARHALAVNSCTAGLHLALAALNIGPGDEVITTPLTFCATVNTILHVGAEPVLADVDEDGNLDPESVRERITPRTKALLPVHLAGQPCKMDALWDLAEQHKLFVVEDAAHAAGTMYQGQQIGSDGHRSTAVAFSFYATKNLTTGEGGMVTTSDPDLYSRMKILCLHGISKDAWNRYSEKGNWYYEVLETGFKYNLSDLQSAVGIHQLRKLEQFTENRRRYADLYRQLLSGVAEIELPGPERSGDRHCYHLFIVRLKLGDLQISRDEFMIKLREVGVGASVHFIPIPNHPYFQSRAELPQNRCPKALAIAERIVSLPLYPAMQEEHVRRVAESVKEIVAKYSRCPVAV